MVPPSDHTVYTIAAFNAVDRGGMAVTFLARQKAVVMLGCSRSGVIDAQKRAHPYLTGPFSKSVSLTQPAFGFSPRMKRP
jgi:hypothetical protein